MPEGNKSNYSKLNAFLLRRLGLLGVNLAMTDAQIKGLITTFLNKRKPQTRYTSFDYCFNYFQSFQRTGRLRDLVAKNNVEKSCLHLGFFLASWGMFRMSGKLGQGVNARHFIQLISEISKWEGSHLYTEMWGIDVPDYNIPEKRELLVRCSKRIKELVLPSAQKAYRALTTKVMLGVFGCAPAFDDFFTETFRNLYGVKQGCAFRTFNDHALQKIFDFYQKHASIIDKYAERTTTLDFRSGYTHLFYTRAKIIDMIGWQKGWNAAERRRQQKKAQKRARLRKLGRSH